jgi:Fanconi anemia group M protein
MSFELLSDDDDFLDAVDVDAVVATRRPAAPHVDLTSNNDAFVASCSPSGSSPTLAMKRRQMMTGKENVFERGVEARATTTLGNSSARMVVTAPGGGGGSGRDFRARGNAGGGSGNTAAAAGREGDGQLTVTSMFAAAAGERSAPTTVAGEIKERMTAGGDGGGDGWRRKRVDGDDKPPPTLKTTMPGKKQKRQHQGRLPKELMIRRDDVAERREMEALRTNLAPEALGDRDAKGLVRCDTAGGANGLPMDPVAIQTYVYPAQISKREYQFEMARNALLTNSLVCLPTGLGKTLIAAVVMYNYYRWFPTGKIIFMAPTRPLVDQQMAACHNVVGIPTSDTIVLMGSTKKDDSGSRREFWRDKRLFFCTPHTVANDLENGDLDASQVVCVVVDEAHHARGQYASAEVLRLLHERDVKFRLLALTATPGQGLEEVQNVVKTLRIGRIDFRSDQDPDVSRYTHKREMVVERVQPDQAMTYVQTMLCDLMRPTCQQLARMGALGEVGYRIRTFLENRPTNGATRVEPPAWFSLQQARQALYANQGRAGHSRGAAFAAFESAMELSKAYELLLKFGSKQAYEYVEKRGEMRNTTLIHRQDAVSKELVDLLRSMSSNGAHHSPKLDRLTSILKQHFKEATADTRVIIFTSYRESVKDIVRALREVPAGADTACKIKVAEFVGQGDSTAGGKKRAPAGKGRSTKGQTQKEQKATLDAFRAGTLNTLVATSIGEEGLDIPSVDLIFFFDVVDIIRAIQRMGRTGRARDGKVVVLATEGKEYGKFTAEQKKYENLMRCLRQPSTHFDLHKKCPRVVPDGVTPVCQMRIIEASPAEKPTKSRIANNKPAVARAKKPKKPRGHKAILNAAVRLLETPLDAASKAILYAYEYPPGALKEMDISACVPFLSRPDSVHAVEHGAWSKTLINVMADLQGMPRVDPRGDAVPGGPCALAREARRARAEAKASLSAATADGDEEDPSHVPDSQEPPPEQPAEEVFNDDWDDGDWDTGWAYGSQGGGNVYEAAVKTSQEVAEEFTQMSNPVPRRISMPSMSPVVEPSPVASAQKSQDLTPHDRLRQDRMSMPPPPPRMTPHSGNKTDGSTPASDGSDIVVKRHVSRVNPRVLMSQEISLLEEEEEENERDADEENEDEDAPVRPRRRQARPKIDFNPTKRRNVFVDDEAVASDEDDREDDDAASSGDERFIAHTQDAADDDMHAGAQFAEGTPRRAARRDVANDRAEIARAFAALGPRERRDVRDTPSPSQALRETQSTSKYDSSFIDDGSELEDGLEDSVARPERPITIDASPVAAARAPQTADEMWDELGGDDDGWGGDSQRNEEDEDEEDIDDRWDDDDGW